MQAHLTPRSSFAPAIRGLAGLVLVSVGGIAAAVASPTPFGEPFRPDFHKVGHVTCPAGAALPRALLDAAACGDAVRVKARLAEGADLSVVEARSRLVGRTALHHAVQRGDREIVEALLGAGITTDTQDADGNTALHLLAMRPRGGAELDIVRLLLQSGADARIRNRNGMTALEVLIATSRYGIDPLRNSPLPLGALLDEAEAKGPTKGQTVRSASPASTEATAATPEALPAAAAEVQTVLAAWAKAWADRDVEAYLAHYADAFKPAEGKSREEWVAQRRSRIGGARTIEVGLEGVTVALEGERAVVEFGQNYRSDSYRSNDRKRIVMLRAAGAWQIVEETTLR